MAFTCSICSCNMVFIPKLDRANWCVVDDEVVHNTSGVPYREKDVPVHTHSNHTFHRRCITNWIKTAPGSEVVSGSLYKKVLSVLLPCVKYPVIYKGPCPLDNGSVIYSDQFIENSALTLEYIKSGKEDMPVPTGCDRSDKYIVPRRTVIEIAFIVTILLFTSIYVYIANAFKLGPKQEGDDPNSYLFRSAKIYKLKDDDFKGYASVGNYFLHPVIKERRPPDQEEGPGDQVPGDQVPEGQVPDGQVLGGQVPGFLF